MGIEKPFRNFVVLLAAGCARDTSQSLETIQPTPVSSKVPVRSCPPPRTELLLKGQVHAIESGTADLTAPLDGVVIRIDAQVGSLVRRGQPLMEISQEKRNPPQLTSLPETPARRTAADRASGFEIPAPIDGRLTKLSVNTGYKVQSGAEVAEVDGVFQVYVDVNVFGADLSRMAPGNCIEVTSPTVPGRKFHGTVQDIGRQVKSQARPIRVRIRVEDPGKLLRPGTLVDVKVSDIFGCEEAKSRINPMP
jgi:multidrug efflux pump subunit AcrA (membrane-fusion protein)